MGLNLSFTLFRPCEVTGLRKSTQFLLEFALHVLPLVHILCELLPGAGCTKVLAVALANGDRIHHDWCSG